MGFDPDAEYSKPPKTKPRTGKVKAMKKPAEVLTLEEKLKSKDVAAGLAATIKACGDGSVYGYNKAIPELEVFPTCLTELDAIIGRDRPDRRGLPFGRPIELWGIKSGGKSTLCYAFMAQLQKEGYLVVLVDMENSFDPEYAAASGVDASKMIYCLPVNGEEAVVMLEIWAKKADALFLDSVGALFSKDTADKKVDEGLKNSARTHLVNRIIAKLYGPLLRRRLLFIAVNQMRRGQPRPGQKSFDSEITTGGEPWAHFIQLQLKVTPGKKHRDKDGNVFGTDMYIRVTKNKIAPKDGTCKLELKYNVGISPEASLLETAVNAEVIEKSGSHYRWNGELIADSRDEAKAWLKANPDHAAEIRTAALQVIPEASDHGPTADDDLSSLAESADVMDFDTPEE